MKALRKAKRISRKSLGAAVALSDKQIQKYEYGDNRVSISKLTEIALVLGVSLNYFTDGLDLSDLNTPHLQAAQL